MLTTVETPPADAAELTFPRYWRRWQSGADMAAMVVRNDTATLGLALLSPPYEHDGESWQRLLSIAVRRGHRRQGIGSRLLAAAEAAARAAGVDRLTATYASRLRTVEAVKSLVERAGWSSPAVYEHRLAGRADWVLGAATDHAGFRQSLARRGYAHQTWGAISAEDHAVAAALVADGSVPAGYRPCPWPQAQQSPYSLALKKDGRLVGWVFGELQPDGRSVLYHTGWVLPPYQKLGWLMGGLIEVCHRQVTGLGPDSIAIYCTAPGNHAMRAIMERRLLPHGPLWMDTRLHTEKRLDHVVSMPTAGSGPGHSG